jgi:hypothetical protein
VEVATQFLRRYEEDPSILKRIVTGNETWVHHYDPESKRQSMEWGHPYSPAKKKFKRQLSAKKIMLTLFCGKDCRKRAAYGGERNILIRDRGISVRFELRSVSDVLADEIKRRVDVRLEKGSVGRKEGEWNVW